MSAVAKIEDLAALSICRLGSSTFDLDAFQSLDRYELDNDKLARNKDDAACCLEINRFR